MKSKVRKQMPFTCSFNCNFPTKERADKSISFMEPENLSSPSFVSSVIRPQGAPSNTRETEVEKSLSSDELYTLGKCIKAMQASDYIRSSNYEGGAIINGKRTSEYELVSRDDRKRMYWLNLMLVHLPMRKRNHLLLVYKIFANDGQYNGCTLESIGKAWTGAEDVEEIRGGYKAWLKGLIHDIWDAERMIPTGQRSKKFMIDGDVF